MTHELMTTLRHDHQEVKAIFKQMVKGGTEAQLRKLCNKLQEEILPHMKAEEKHIYPPLLKAKDSKEDTLEALEEHMAAAMVLNQLVEMKPTDEHFIAKTKVLKEMVEHHIQEEEDKIFDYLEEMKEADVDKLLLQFSKTKEEIKSSIQTHH